MLARDMDPELSQAVRSFYIKTGQVKGLMGDGNGLVEQDS